MPLKSTGNVISNIKFNKKNVVLYFNKDKVSISPDAYSLNYLYVGKVLSRKEINELTEFSKTDEALKKAMSLLRKGHYSEFHIREKLKEKEFDSKTINAVVKFLKNNDLINDEMLANDLMEYFNEKNYGKNRIINELRNKGIFDVTISKLKFPESLEKKKAKEYLQEIEPRLINLSYEKKKERLYTSLMGRGFEMNVVLSTLEGLKNKDEKQEKKNLNRDFSLIYMRLSSRYEDEELKEKIFKAMKNKGYKFKDIQKMMEEKFL